MLLGTFFEKQIYGEFLPQKFIAWYCWKALEEWDFSEMI
jgi:hypothetical protein